MRIRSCIVGVALAGCIQANPDPNEDPPPDMRPDRNVVDAGAGGGGGDPEPGFGGNPEPGFGGNPEPGFGGNPEPGFGGDPGGEGGFGGDPGFGGVGGDPEPGYGGNGGGAGYGGDPGGEGGFGGVGGDGGFGGVGGGQEPTCESECARLTDCAIDQCVGIDAENAPAFADGCAETCNANPAFLALSQSQARCAALVDTFRAVSADFAEACDGAQPPPPEGDTAPLGPVAGFGPTARLTFMDVPPDSATALAAGCRVAGARNGSALGGLLGLLGEGSLDDWVTPDDRGQIGNVLFMYLADWQAGETGNQLERSDLFLLRGLQLPGNRFEIDPAEFEDGDPNRLSSQPLLAVTERAQLRTGRGTVAIDYPLLSFEMPSRIELEQATYEGQLRVVPGGFDSLEGRLQGYLTQAALNAAIAAFYETCEGPMPAEMCRNLQQIAPTAQDLQVLLEMLIGFDVRLGPNLAAQDCDANCNAVGVCILTEFTGQPVEPLGPGVP